MNFPFPNHRPEQDTGTIQVNPIPVIEICGETILERHLREELRIANAHLEEARRELRRIKTRNA